MSRVLDKEPNNLPKIAKPTLSFLSIISNLEKMAIIEEGEGKISRNFKDLDLSNSIYTKE